MYLRDQPSPQLLRPNNAVSCNTLCILRVHHCRILGEEDPIEPKDLLIELFLSEHLEVRSQELKKRKYFQYYSPPREIMVAICFKL